MNPDFIWIAVTTVVEGIIALGSGTRSLVLCNSDISVELTILEIPLYKLCMKTSSVYATETKIFKSR